MAIIFSSVFGDVVVAVATFLVILYLYYANVFSYWKRRGVHYIKPTSILGNMGSVALQQEHHAELFKRVYDTNGDQPFVGLFNSAMPTLMLRDLEVVRAVMVKDAHAFLDRPTTVSEDNPSLLARSIFFLKGKRWRNMRIKLTPTFTSGKIKNMFSIINEYSKQLVPCIDLEMSKGKCVVKDTVARYSTDVIASCAFGFDTNTLADPNCEFRAFTRKIFDSNALPPIVTVLMVLFPRLFTSFAIMLLQYSYRDYIRKTFWDVVDYRRKNKVVRKDFVDTLMQIQDKGQIQAEDDKDLEEIKKDSKYIDTEHTQSDNVDIKLEDDDYVAQAFVFIAAGFETSSSVITFTLYELARNPAIQDKLRKEIQTVLNKHNSEVTYGAIAEMSYLEMVISEAMRKYPTLPVLERTCLSDYKIPGTDVTIEKGVNIAIPVLAIHWDPDIYPEPDEFDPERFSPENKSKRSNFAYLPFGEGPRICIGMRFGQMQVKAALVHILTSFKVKPCADTPQPPLGMKSLVAVNIPRKDIVLAFEKIN